MSLVLARPCASISLLIPGVNPLHGADGPIGFLVHFALRVLLTLVIWTDAAVVFIVACVAIPGLVVRWEAGIIPCCFDSDVMCWLLIFSLFLCTAMQQQKA